jgi:hypothetical protein
MLPELGAMPGSAASSELSADLTARLSTISPAICALPAAFLGMALIAGGLWGIRRWSAPRGSLESAVTERAAPLKPGLVRWLGRTWPLLLIVPLTLFVMGAELVMGRFPELLSMGRPVQFRAAPWTGPQTWRYEVRNVLEERVGTAECALEQAAGYTLSCSRQRSQYEADTGQGVYFGENVQENTSAQWQGTNLHLTSVERHRQGGTIWRSFSAAPQGDAVGVTLTLPGGELRRLRLPIPEPVPALRLRRADLATVIEGSEWPWRFSALPFQGFYSAQAALLDPDPIEGTEPTLTYTSVVVYGAEPIATPAGSFVAWRVEVGDHHVAWYDAEAPHTLVALEDGIESWVLTSVE